MLLVLLSWVILIFVFLAFGNILISVWNKVAKREDSFSFFDTFFLGLSATGALAVIISLFFPLNIFALLLFIGITLAYWIVNRRKLAALFKDIIQGFQDISVWTKIILALAFLIISVWAIQVPMNADYGLYHMQSIMWTEAYSVVPGLGNLHGRLAFNSTYLILTTLFSYHPQFYIPFYPLNSLCMMVFAVWLLLHIDKALSAMKVLAILGIFVLIIVPYGSSLPSTSTDILPGIVICYLLFSCILDKDSLLARILPLCIIPVFCMTLKLSSAALLLLPLYIFILLIKKKDYRPILNMLGLGIIIIIPWCIRFIILSGYLIYPFDAIDIFSFDWKMPIELVEGEKNAAYYWARVPGRSSSETMHMSFREWFPIWLDMRPKEDMRFFILAVISPLTIFLGIKAIKEDITFLIIWLIALAGCIYCFLTAPDLRFCWGFFIALGTMPFILWQPKLLEKKILKVVPFGLFFLFFIDYYMMELRRGKYLQKDLAPLYTLIYKPQPYDYMEKEDNPQYKEIQVQGVTIYYTPGGDLCYEKCLPCTPYLRKGLEFRGETLQDGFRIKKE